jgi:GNAT superfamily N-acetyltransferase|tara:strand:- start:1077 stop:1547 length:471 start_codon:yes stop_codon:yes gene_type:complete
MPEIKYLSQCTPDQAQAAYQFYLTSFDYYEVEYDEAKQRALIDTLIQADWFDALIYFDADTPRGFCFFVNTYSSLKASMCLRIEEMFVNAKFHNQGIGTQLLQRLIEHSQQNEISKIYLDAETRGKGSIDFYKRLGFEPLPHSIPARLIITIDEQP